VVAARDRLLRVAARLPAALAAGAVCVLASAILSLDSASNAGESIAGARPVAAAAPAIDAERTIQVDRASFWYEAGPRCAGLARFGLPCAPAGSAERVAEATAAAIRDRPYDFPQPPPLPIVVRARPPERLPDTFQTIADVYSYGGAELVDGIVVIDVNLTAFIGDTPLNDAELRSFLGHEIVHAYQDADGPAPKNSPELWRREVEAFDWELLHMEPGVRSWYRAEAIFNRDMYRRLLEEP
jgi:hypothetical protein